MSLALRWYQRKADKLVRADPQPLYARTLLHRGAWRFPVLRACVAAPTLDQDGRVIEHPGFDAASGLLLDFDEGTFPPVPVAPTKDEARVALATLLRPLRGFPFVTEAAKSVVLSHRSMKNVVKLEYSDSPWELERAVVRFVDDSNHRRQHEALANVTPALDRHEQLVQMPDVTHPATSASERARIVGPEGLAPLSDRFGGHGDPAFREEIFDIAKAQTKAVGEPDRVTTARCSLR